MEITMPHLIFDAALPHVCVGCGEQLGGGFLLFIHEESCPKIYKICEFDCRLCLARLNNESALETHKLECPFVRNFLGYQYEYVAAIRSPTENLATDLWHILGKYPRLVKRRKRRPVKIGSFGCKICGEPLSNKNLLECHKRLCSGVKHRLHKNFDGVKKYKGLALDLWGALSKYKTDTRAIPPGGDFPFPLSRYATQLSPEERKGLHDPRRQLL